MTDDAFEALWYLYQISRRNLSDMASRTKRKSHLTYFKEALDMAVARSNNVESFLKFWERALELDFKVDYGFPLPSQQAFATLFQNVRKHGSLYYMPQLNDRIQQVPVEEITEEESNG
jgi:hypothetical protein